MKQAVQFGTSLRALRQARALTQDQLAEAADLGPKYVGEMERGIRNPSLDVLSKLAQALNVDIAELVGDELTQLDRDGLVRLAQAELARCSNEELRAWLRVQRGRR